MAAGAARYAASEAAGGAAAAGHGILHARWLARLSADGGYRARGVGAAAAGRPLLRTAHAGGMGMG